MKNTGMGAGAALVITGLLENFPSLLIFAFSLFLIIKFRDNKFSCIYKLQLIILCFQCPYLVSSMGRAI